MTRKLIRPTIGRCHGLPRNHSNSTDSEPPNIVPITEFKYDNSVAPPAGDASDRLHVLESTTKGFPLDDAIIAVENTMNSGNMRHVQDLEMIDQAALLAEDVEDLRDGLSEDRSDNIAPISDTGEEEESEYEEGVFWDEDHDGEDAQENRQHEEESPTTSPTPRTSVIDTDPTTEIPHYTKPFNMSPFDAAVRLFVQKWSVTREQWADFRSMLHLLQNVPPEVAALPARVDTLKTNLDQQLPLLKIRSRELDLDIDLLHTRSGQDPKRRKEEIGLFDMKTFFKRLLQADTIMKRSHIGMAVIVDQPTEFWHSNSWGGSNRTTSGRFAKVRSGKYRGDVVLVSDFVWYYNQKGTRSIGRVTFVGVDERLVSRKDRSFGKIKLRLQPVCSRRQVDRSHWHTIDKVQIRSGEEELFLVEDADPLYITEDKLIRHDENIHIDYNFSTSTPSTPTSKKYRVRFIFNIGSNTLRPVALSHPLRGELEIIEFQKIGYNRNTMIHHLDSATKTIKSFPYTLFIDSFGLYRNMYRPIPGFYAQFAFLNELDRKKRINVFPITLAPFAAKWDEVVDSLLHLKELEVGVEVTLDDNSTVTICAPCLAYVGDMPQQQGNAGCKNQKADHFCRSCLISSSNANDIRYDVITHGRYHNETIRVREEAKKKSKKDQTQIFKDLGLNDKPSPLTRLTPSLCIPLAFPGDVAHSEFKGIARQVLNLLFSDVIKTSFHEAFARSFAATPTPQGWATIQNLHRYIGSFSMQEFGRAITIVPITLRKWLSDIRVRPKYLAAIQLHLESEECTYNGELYCVDFLVHCYATIARLNAVIMGPYIRAQDRDKTNELVIESRERMQDLLEIAVIAATTNPTSARTCTPNFSWQRRRTSSLTRQVIYPSDLEESDAESMDISDLDSDDTRFGDEEEEVPMQTLGCRRKKLQLKEQEESETKRVEALRRKKFTPNVHTIRHVMDTITEYASARNVTTWSGEDRHKTFKNEILKTNHQKPSVTLLKREQRRQTIHLILGGAFKTSHPELTECFQIVNTKCPSLLRYLTVSDTHLDCKQDANVDAQAIVNDSTHLESAALKRIYPKSLRLKEDPFLSVIWPHRLNVQHPFRSALRDAYTEDYDIRNTQIQDKLAIQWAAAFRFVDSRTNRTITFQLNTFVRVRKDTIGSISGIFTHYHDKARRLFIVIEVADGDFRQRGVIESAQDPSTNSDPILCAHTFKMAGERIIVGLPSIGTQRIWVVPAITAGEFWFIDQDVYYM